MGMTAGVLVRHPPISGWLKIGSVGGLGDCILKRFRRVCKKMAFLLPLFINGSLQ
jgi:hypothetical protein